MAEVRRRAAEKGIVVSIPTTDSVRYDLVLDDAGHLYRVQVKYCNRNAVNANGAVQIELTSYHRSGKLSSRGYTADEIDALLLYVPRIDAVLWLGAQIFANRPQIQIRFEPTRNGQAKGCLFAQDYIW